MQEALDTGLIPRRRIPLVLQAEMAECGLACLSMVMAAYGRDIALSSLRTRYPVPNTGMTMARMADIARLEGMMLTGYQAEMADLEQLRLPAILHWDNNHFVVLVEVKAGRSITVHDPAIGEVVHRWADATPRFSGVAAELAPLPTFAKEVEKPKVSVWHMLRQVGGYKALMVKLALLTFFVEIALIVSPLFLQTVVDEVMPVHDDRLLFTLATGFICVALIRVAAQMARGWTSMALAGLMTAAFKSSVFTHLLHLPLTWFDKRGLGTVAARFGSLNHIRQITSEGVLLTSVDGVLALVMLAVIGLYAPLLSVVTVIVSLIGFVGTAVLYRAYSVANNQQIQADAQENNTFLELVSGIGAVKFFGREAQQQRLYTAAMLRSTNRSMDVERLQLLHRSVLTVVAALEEIVVITLAGYMVLNGKLTVGTMFGFYAYKQIFSAKIASLTNSYLQLRLLGIHTQNVADITAMEPEKREQTPLVVRPKPSLKFENICFRYDESEEHVLKDLNLEVRPGEIVGVTGPSGCGKSTLVKLLTGALQPESGAIRLDGVDLTKVAPGTYRPLMAVVMQDESLFTGNVIENITMFEEAPDMARVRDAARLAALDKDLEAMSMGLHTHVMAGSPALSGGQRQRLVLARAFYKRAPVLVLDEATSALDVEREQLIAQAIRELGLTTFIVAHRKETLDGCDRVIRLEPHSDRPLG